MRQGPQHASAGDWRIVTVVSRLDIPPGQGGDAVQIWSLQPELGAAATRFVHAAYNKSILPTRVREAARMRIAQLNECTVCLGFRADTVKAQGLNEEFYSTVGTPGEVGLTEQERLAVEYAERFAINHTSIDDEFIERLRTSFTDAEIFDLDCLSIRLPRTGTDVAGTWDHGDVADRRLATGARRCTECVVAAFDRLAQAHLGDLLRECPGFGCPVTDGIVQRGEPLEL